jgi:hypothetical protein
MSTSFNTSGPPIFSNWIAFTSDALLFPVAAWVPAASHAGLSLFYITRPALQNWNAIRRSRIRPIV